MQNGVLQTDLQVIKVTSILDRNDDVIYMQFSQKPLNIFR